MRKSMEIVTKICDWTIMNECCKEKEEQVKGVKRRRMQTKSNVGKN